MMERLLSKRVRDDWLMVHKVVQPDCRLQAIDLGLRLQKRDPRRYMDFFLDISVQMGESCECSTAVLEVRSAV